MSEKDELMSEQELIALCRRDFSKEVNASLRKTKDAFVDQIKDDIIRYVKTNEAKQLKSVLIHEKKIATSADQYNEQNSPQYNEGSVSEQDENQHGTDFSDDAQYQESFGESPTFHSNHYDFEEEEEEDGKSANVGSVIEDESNFSDKYHQNVSDINEDKDNSQQEDSRNEMSAFNEYDIHSSEEQIPDNSDIDHYKSGNDFSRSEGSIGGSKDRNLEYLNSEKEEHQDQSSEKDEQEDYDIGGFGDF